MNGPKGLLWGESGRERLREIRARCAVGKERFEVRGEKLAKPVRRQHYPDFYGITVFGLCRARRAPRANGRLRSAFGAFFFVLWGRINRENRGKKEADGKGERQSRKACREREEKRGKSEKRKQEGGTREKRGEAKGEET